MTAPTACLLYDPGGGQPDRGETAECGRLDAQLTAVDMGPRRSPEPPNAAEDDDHGSDMRIWAVAG